MSAKLRLIYVRGVRIGSAVPIHGKAPVETAMRVDTLRAVYTFQLYPRASERRMTGIECALREVSAVYANTDRFILGDCVRPAHVSSLSSIAPYMFCGRHAPPARIARLPSETLFANKNPHLVQGAGTYDIDFVSLPLTQSQVLRCLKGICRGEGL